VRGYSASLVWRGLVAIAGTGAAALLFAVGANAATGNIITNGSFETGTLSGWTVHNGVADNCDLSSNTWTVLSSPSDAWCYSGFDPDWPTDISAVDGSHFADVTWDGSGDTGLNFSLTHMVTVPATGFSDLLTWSDNASWDLGFGATDDRQEFVDVLGSDGTTVLQSVPIQTLDADSEGATGWVSRSLDLSAYAGQTIGIRFRLTVPEDFTGPANFALDAVTLIGELPSGGPRGMVCLKSPAVRVDGTTGLFFDVDASTLDAGIDDPNSIFFQAVPAIYVKGYGTMCQISDLVTYGGDPTKFTDAGYKVNESGIPTPQGVSPADWGATYEYYVPTG
jgi:hypothetical protein